LSVPVGCAGIHLRRNWVNEYPSMRLSTSNKGWHSHWFYIKDDIAAPLPAFSRRIIKDILESWKWGVSDKDKKKIKDHLTTIQILKERGVKGSGIIGAYNAWRVVLMMRRALPLHMMALMVSLNGTALAEGALSPSEVVQRIKEVMEPSKDTVGVILDFVFPVPGHPPMRLEPGFIDFVSFLSPYSFLLEFPTP